MELLQAVLELCDRYGVFIVLGVLAILNAGKILDAVIGVIAKIYPAWRKERAERATWQRRQVNRSYTDAVGALQALLDEACEEIKSARQERRILQAHLLRHLSRYEHLAASTVEAFRDVGDQIHQIYLQLCALNGNQPEKGERL
jgi:hypothetical protein